jgi:small subunit ribosomal protein S14
MSMFRAKKLDIGSFVNIKTIRDHTKRKVFAEFEPQRCARIFSPSLRLLSIPY